LELFDQRRAELLASGTPLAYQGTVDATFTLALDQLRETNSAAVHLMKLCALLAPTRSRCLCYSASLRCYPNHWRPRQRTTCGVLR
jgi:hypothetical protein